MSKTLIPIHITFKLIKGKYVLYYKGKRYKVWNDMGPIREVKWFYNFIPSRFIDWDNNGIKLKL